MGNIASWRNVPAHFEYNIALVCDIEIEINANSKGIGKSKIFFSSNKYCFNSGI